MDLKKTFTGFILLLLVPFFLGAQTSPEEFLGHKVGADRKLADYNQIQAYFQKLDEESGKIKILTIGTSTLGKPMIMAVISSEKNMAELDKYRQISKKLSEARGLSPDEAKNLATVHLKADIAHDLTVAECLGDPLQAHHTGLKL